MQIKEFAQKFNMTTDGIRYYEKKDLIAPKRSENGYRHYDEKCEQALQLILFLKGLGFQLSEIKQVIQLHQQPISLECNVLTTSLMEQKIDEVTDKIQFYQQAQQILLYVLQLINENKYAENKEVIQQLITKMYKK